MLLKWTKITDDVCLLNEVAIPRCYFKFESSKVTTQLHSLCDTTERAFVAVVYLRSAYTVMEVLKSLCWHPKLVLLLLSDKASLDWSYLEPWY